MREQPGLVTELATVSQGDILSINDSAHFIFFCSSSTKGFAFTCKFSLNMPNKLRPPTLTFY